MNDNNHEQFQKLHSPKINSNHIGGQAHFYDFYNSDYIQDLSFYTKYLSKYHLPDVLEIGIGTGRLALNLNRLCNTYTGIDYSNNMLNVLSSKLKEKTNSNIMYYNTNMLDYNLNSKFDIVVYPYRVFPYCTSIDDIKKTLITSKAHLRNKSSRIIINSVVFNSNYIKFWNNNTYSFNFNYSKKVYKLEQIISFKNNVMMRTVNIYNEFGKLISNNTDNLFGISPQELLSICTECGFKLYRIWNDYTYSSPLKNDELDKIDDEYIIEIGIA